MNAFCSKKKQENYVAAKVAEENVESEVVYRHRRGR